ncbi:MAG: hypothetical protein EHJ95_06165 [Methanobacteriota archaeon]|nr:MAG: hypothetical protein EHJ95_06165 [Euryarchaeota archaeon]
MTAPHPQRCETCDFHTENQYMDFCHGYSMSSDDSTEIIIHIQKYGCASHSTASNADDVLDKFYKQLKKERDEIFDGVGMDDIDYIYWKLKQNYKDTEYTEVQK